MVNQKKIDYLIKNFPSKIKWVLKTFNEGIKDTDVVAFSILYQEQVYIPEIIKFAVECLDMYMINEYCGPSLKIGDKTRKLVPMYHKYVQINSDFLET
jgi:hypothetical protein